MAGYRIEQHHTGIVIEVTGVAGHQEELLEAFGECQSGHCTCPTEEYRKVVSMDIVSADEEITLRLEAKPGERFDTDEISTCLDHTLSKVERP